jgi:prepilin-type N-terminal cleavage/methylation domain-containing protein
MLKHLFNSKKEKGFSLIELLLVIAILGIIAGVAIPSYMGQRKRARVTGDAETNVKVIQMALDQRRADMGFFGKPEKYEYKHDGTRPAVDIVPAFHPKGNTKMDFEIEIGETGLTYIIKVTDPLKSNKEVLTANETGAVTRNKYY